MRLTEQEQKIVDALTETELGREGLIQVKFFTKENQELVKDMVQRGILKYTEIGSNAPVSAETIGLSSKLYPSNLKELTEFRESKKTWFEKVRK